MKWDLQNNIFPEVSNLNTTDYTNINTAITVLYNQRQVGVTIKQTLSVIEL